MWHNINDLGNVENPSLQSRVLLNQDGDHGRILTITAGKKKGPLNLPRKKPISLIRGVILFWDGTSALRVIFFSSLSYEVSSTDRWNLPRYICDVCTKQVRCIPLTQRSKRLISEACSCGLMIQVLHLRVCCLWGSKPSRYNDHCIAELPPRRRNSCVAMLYVFAVAE